MSTAINASGLVKRFETTTALDQVSLTVEPGELRGLLGPYGAREDNAVADPVRVDALDDGRSLRPRTMIRGLPVERPSAQADAPVGDLGQLRPSAAQTRRPRRQDASPGGSGLNAAVDPADHH